jgi:hypothetical protein
MALKIVVENDDAELQRNGAIAVLERALKRLAANLLRSVRGAGRPAILGDEMVAVMRAMQEYRDVVGHYPESELLSAILRFREPDELTERLSKEEAERHSAEERLLAGALQTVASRLLDQRTQEASGRTELYEGFRLLEDIRRENFLRANRVIGRDTRKSRKAKSTGD